MPDGSERKLAAILSADVVGYSRLIAADEDATVRRLTAYREQIGVLVRDHRGRVADFTGDNFLAEFPSAEEAVLCAVEIQRVLKARNEGLPPDQKMEFRIGSHLGDIRVEEGRLYGEGVNIAARLEGIAEHGGICVSAQIYELVRHRLGVAFEDLGDRSVRNIPEPVRVYRVAFEAAPAESTADPDAARAHRRYVWPAAVVLAGLVVALVAWRLGVPGSRPLPVGSAGPIRSLAVLPLDNLSGEADQAYFVEGLTEELTATLSRIRGLRVISRTSAMQYADARIPLPRIARELGVDALIEGSVLRVGDRVRITVQLIRAVSDEHLWAESYTRPLTDVFALQSEVARAIAKAVNLKLTPAEQQQLASAPSVDVDAHEAYLRGRYFLQKGSVEGNLQALEYFELAIREDPEFARAYAGLADASSCESCVSLPEEAMIRAKEAALRAIELDESLAEAHTALGMIKSMHEWDFPGGEIEFKRAMALNPGDVRAHVLYARVLEGMGRLDEAIAEAEIAQQLDPLSLPVAVNLGALYARGGEYARAVDQFDRALELDPDSAAAHRSRGRLECDRGNFEAALAELRSARSLSPSESVILAELGYCLVQAGNEAEARGLLKELEEGQPGDRIAPMTPALIHVGLGEYDEAFEWLERAYDARATLLPSVLTDPRYAQVRTDPRFADLLRRMGARQASSPTS
ncbi:MAG: tetratricopeptide repeat protein [Myxococcota bacterium]